MEWRDSMVKRMRKKRFKGEDGSIIVESAFSLPFFMFAIVIILSFVNICSTQAIVTNAMNGMAADFGKISYLYAKLGILDWKEDAAAAGADVTSAGQKVMSIRVSDLEEGLQALDTLQEVTDALSECEDIKASLLFMYNNTLEMRESLELCLETGQMLVTPGEQAEATAWAL